MKHSLRACSIVILIFSVCAVSQTGGTYDLSHNVVASGGSMSSAGQFVVAGTVGQGLAGTISGGGQYSLRNGFWAFQALEPTAAPVSLSGHITLTGDSEMSRVRLTLHNLSTGAVFIVRPNQLGYYHFGDLETGVYLLRPEGQGYRFSPTELVVSLLDDLEQADFAGVRIDQ